MLYGAVFDPAARPSDVVVIVRGPEQPVRIARKTAVAGVWLNSRPVVFQGAPGFYIAASTRPLDDIAGFGVLRRLGAGVDHLAHQRPGRAAAPRPATACATWWSAAWAPTTSTGAARWCG